MRDRESLRILIAVEERRLYRNTRGRFEIDGEEPPDRRTREQLRRGGLIVPVYGNDGYRLTATGEAELKREIRRGARTIRARTKRLQARGLSFSDAYEKAIQEARA